eukprot:c25879_g1_i1 orf=582-1295(-)
MMARPLALRWPRFMAYPCRISVGASQFLHQPHHLNRVRLLNIFSIFSKEAVEKERLRLKDELNRGYFDDLKEFKEHGGKIAIASKVLVPAMAASKFPSLVVQFTNGHKLTLPFGAELSEKDGSFKDAYVTLVCMTFRANAQKMIESWSEPFLDAFKFASEVRLCQVSYIDSSLLSFRPIRWLLLQAMHSPQVTNEGELMKQVVYAFGDSYDFRKALQITNLLTGGLDIALQVCLFAG